LFSAFDASVICYASWDFLSADLAQFCFVCGWQLGLFWFSFCFFGLYGILVVPPVRVVVYFFPFFLILSWWIVFDGLYWGAGGLLY